MTKEASPEWNVLLAPFQSLFSKPGFRYFCVFVRVLAHLDGRLWVTHVVLSGLWKRHWTNYYRFLRSQAWSVEAVARQVWALCLPVCQDGQGRVFVAVDDTVCRKTGTHFEGLGVHYDPMNHDAPRHLSHGHCWVMLAALARHTGGQAVALLVSCALYVPRKACASTTPYQSKLALAARLLDNLAVAAPGSLVAICDGAYARRPFVQAVCTPQRSVLSRLRRDAVFYDLPPARLPGQKGATRKFGDKHKALTWAAQTSEWQAACLLVYGRARRVRLKSRLVLLRRLGVTARLVAVQWTSGKTVFLFSTDLTLSAPQIVEAMRPALPSKPVSAMPSSRSDWQPTRFATLAGTLACCTCVCGRKPCCVCAAGTKHPLRATGGGASVCRT